MTNPELIEYRVTPHPSSKVNKQRFPHGAVAVIVNEQGAIQHIENRNEKLFGYAHKSLINKPFANLIASSDQMLYFGTFLGKHAHEGEVKLTLCHANGYFFPAQIEARPIDALHASKQQAALNLWKKVSDDQAFNKQAEMRAHFGTWHLDMATQELRLSRGVYRLLGLEDNPELTVEQLLYFFGEQQNRVKARLRRCFRHQCSVNLDTQLLNKHQQRQWVRLYAEAEISDGKTTELRGSVEDISYRKTLQFKASYFDACLSSLMEQSDDLIVILDNRGRVIAFNDLYQKAFQSLFDQSLKKGDQFEQLLTGFSVEQRIYQKLWGLMLYRDQITMEMPLAQRHERLPVYQINLRQLKNKQGQRLGISFVAKLSQASSSGKFANNHLARHDPLTGLYNLKEFQYQLSRRCQNTEKNASKHILVYIDLCHFSILNKRLGAEAGDAILKQCSRVMKGQLRERDALARLGADEFGAILENCNASQAVIIAHQLRDSIRTPGFKWQGKCHALDLQAGIVPITKHSDNAVSLLKLAKNTCLAAAGNTPPIRRYRFTKQSQSHAESRHYIHLIKQALSNEESLILDYQSIRPINEWIDGQFVELLSRIRTSDGETIMPGQFLSTAQSFDFMCNLDKNVLIGACNWLAQQQQKVTHRALVCSINVSLESIQSDDFIPFIQTLLNKHGLSPASLCLELSETCCLNDPDVVKDGCTALRAAGFKVLIDHVGSTSLDARYLLDLDIDMLKLDGALTRNTAAHPAKKLTVEYIVRMAGLKGVKTIASQLESKESVHEATRLGIHFGQGFELARPKQLSSLQVA